MTDHEKGIAPLDLPQLDNCCRNHLIVAVENYTEPGENGVVLFLQGFDGAKKEVRIKSSTTITAEAETIRGAII